MSCHYTHSLRSAAYLMYNQPLMTQVTKKDDQEHLENLLRRFNRKVQQSGALTTARRRLYHEKPQSRTQRRQAALARQERKKAKIRKMYLGR